MSTAFSPMLGHFAYVECLFLLILIHLCAKVVAPESLPTMPFDNGGLMYSPNGQIECKLSRVASDFRMLTKTRKATDHSLSERLAAQ